MLSLWNEAYIERTNNTPLLAEEPNSGKSPEKVLLINTRSFQSEIVEQGKESEADPQDFFMNVLKENDDLRKSGVPPFDVQQMTKLKLSSDQTVDDWVELAQLIEKNYGKYCGFVVQGGTDSMVYISTALSFMLVHLGKPVIFTGSLIPGDRVYTDMKRNTIVALLFASCGKLSEVCMLFDECLFRANRLIKTSRIDLRPYESPHFPPIGAMQGGELRLYTPLLMPYPKGRLQVMPYMHTLVLPIKLVPSVPQQTLLHMVNSTAARAIVILAYGSGNGPSHGNYMANVMKAALSRDILVVVCTQNRHGVVSLNSYEVGRQLLEAGALSAGDMTFETVLIKFKYLFGIGLSTAQVRSLFNKNFRGEATELVTKL